MFPVNVMGSAQQQQQQIQQQQQLSPQVKRRQNFQSQPQIIQQPTPTRPISFVRALEMSDSMDLFQGGGNGQDGGAALLMSKSASDKLGVNGVGMSNSSSGLHGSHDHLLSNSPRMMNNQNGGILVGGVQQQQQVGQQQQQQQTGSANNSERAASVYDMNYEISV